MIEAGLVKSLIGVFYEPKIFSRFINLLNKVQISLRLMVPLQELIQQLHENYLTDIHIQ